jgi:3-hydroxyisobutyrate dehydrogenase-like beta-hydroxyacid dehydrogenase
MHIAVLGLGRMGRAVSTRLLDKEYDVTVWNRTPGREGDLPAKGATVASSIKDAVQGADAAMTLLTADAAVKQVCLGHDGAIAHMADEAILIDMSTVSPETSRELGEKTPGGHFVDAPILGGPEATAQGGARLLLGGDENVVHRLDTLWNDLSAGYFYCGLNGSATSMKLLSNLILVGGTMLLAEAVVTGQANGIGDDILRQVLGGSPAVAPGVKPRMEDIIGGDHEGWWTILLAEKDIALALQLATSQGLQLPVGSTVEDVLHRTDAAGYGEKDLAAVVETFRQKWSLP